MQASELVERVWSEWLYAGGEKRPPYDILNTTINSSATTIDTKQRQNYRTDSVIELEYELVAIESAVRDTPSAGLTRLTVNERGYLESAAAAHTAPVRIYLEPDYPKITILNSLRAIVGQLYGWGIYWAVNDSSLTYTEVNVQALPSGTLDVVYAEVKRPGPENYDPLYNGRNYMVHQAFATPKIEFMNGGVQGQSVYLVLKKDFGTITDQTTDLDSIGVPTTLQPFLPMAVAGSLLRGRELTRQQIDEVRKVIADAGTQVPAGAAISTGNDLIRTFRTTAVENERRRLRNRYGIRRVRVG